MPGDQRELNSIAKLQKAIDKSLARAAKVLSNQTAQSNINKNDFHLMAVAKAPGALIALQAELDNVNPQKVNKLLSDEKFLASICDLSYIKQKEKIENELDDINKQLESGKSNVTPTATPGHASPMDLSSEDEDWDKNLDVDSNIDMSTESVASSREEMPSLDEMDWGEDEDMRPDLSLEERTTLQARTAILEAQLSQSFSPEKTLLSQAFSHLRVLNKSLAQLSPQEPAPSATQSRVKAMVNEYESKVQEVKQRIKGNKSPQGDVDKRNNKP